MLTLNEQKPLELRYRALHCLRRAQAPRPSLVKLIQTSPKQYRLEGADTLKFELSMESVDKRFEQIENLLGTLNQKVAAA